MEYSVGSIILKKVVNTEKTTQITARVYTVKPISLEGKKPYTKKLKGS